MTKKALLKFLRNAVLVQAPGIENDSKYLTMTDEDLENLLSVVLSRDYATVKSLDSLPADAVYPILILAKKELYYTLAVKEAPLYDMGADNNNYLKRSQRFDHYLKLIAQADKEYQDWLEGDPTGTHGTVYTYDVLLSRRYYTRRYKNLALVPIGAVYPDKVTASYIEVSWEAYVTNFLKYEVYITDEPFYDIYSNEGRFDGKKIEPVATITSQQDRALRIKGLEPNKSYVVTLIIYDRCGLNGYAELKFNTLLMDNPIVPKPLISTTSLGEKGGD